MITRTTRRHGRANACRFCGWRLAAAVLAITVAGLQPPWSTLALIGGLGRFGAGFSMGPARSRPALPARLWSPGHPSAPAWSAMISTVGRDRAFTTYGPILLIGCTTRRLW